MRRKLLPFLFALLFISTTLVATSHAAPFACISNNVNNTVSILDTASAIVTTVAVVNGPYGIAVNPEGTRSICGKPGQWQCLGQR